MDADAVIVEVAMNIDLNKYPDLMIEAMEINEIDDSNSDGEGVRKGQSYLCRAQVPW